MACKKCGHTKSSPCACKDTALTTPCLDYSTLNDPHGRFCGTDELCHDIQCQECVSYCHGDENHFWSVEEYSSGATTIEALLAGTEVTSMYGGGNVANPFTVQNGERLDGILQRLTMWLAGIAEGNTDAYEHSVTYFYADNPTQSQAGGDMVKLHWGPAIVTGNLSAVSIWYADATAIPYVWNQVTTAENLNLANVSEFTVTTVLAPNIMPGGTYVFKLVGIDGNAYWNPSAPFVYVEFLA
jgi:hypothetical protein